MLVWTVVRGSNLIEGMHQTMFFFNNRWHGTDWALTLWVIVIVPSVENRWFKRLSCDAMAEPPLKKQKLTRDWFLEQLQGLELSDDLKKSVAEFLVQLPPDDIYDVSFQSLSYYLENTILDDAKRRLVVVCMLQRIQREFAPAPVPRTQSLFCSFNPISQSSVFLVLVGCLLR